MSKYNSFRKRVNPSNITSSSELTKDKVVERAKRLFLNSPTLETVFVNQNKEEKVLSIVSEDKKMKFKRFLFLPETNYKMGSYIEHKEDIYLATDRSKVDGYPQLFGELCNHDYVIEEIISKIRVGVDSLGRPIYEEFKELRTIPSVITNKVYSSLSNNPVSLPSGALLVKLPYSEEVIKKVNVNDSYILKGAPFKVVDLSFSDVYKDEGCLIIHLQRKVDNTYE